MAALAALILPAPLLTVCFQSHDKMLTECCDLYHQRLVHMLASLPQPLTHLCTIPLASPSPHFVPIQHTPAPLLPLPACRGVGDEERGRTGLVQKGWGLWAPPAKQQSHGGQDDRQSHP